MSPVAMTIETASATTGGKLLRGPGAAGSFVGVAIDSRRVEPGQAFVAIAGDRFDGHDFVVDAARRGAALVVVERAVDARLPGAGALLRVEQTRVALGQLARAWKRQVAPTTVAITGSVGKTTTKELTRTLLADAGPTHWNRGNFNNDIGLPLTLLELPEQTAFLVAEMGMNAPGEIAYLTSLAEPDVGLVTCVAPVHLEGLGSLEAIAEAKGELLRGLHDGARAVVPGGESLLAASLASIPAELRVTFGDGDSDDVRIVEVQGLGARGSRVRLSLRGDEIQFDLALVGAYNARNAAAAAGVGMVLGLAPDRIAHALGTALDLGHRSRVREVGPWQLLDDCYNANPVATRAALDTLIQLGRGGGAVAVLGEMLELGQEAERYHEEVGRHAARVGLDLLVAVGGLGSAIARGAVAAGMPRARVVLVQTPEEAVQVVADRAGVGSRVLVKASRGARLERVIEALTEIAGETGEERRGNNTAARDRRSG